MRITVLAVGKIRERYLEDAVAEYAKRLSRYCSLSIMQVADEPAPDTMGRAGAARVLLKEGRRLLDKIDPDDYCIALTIEGGQKSSVELAEHLDRLGVSGKSRITFVIGGSLGLSPEVLSRADECLSFSRLTFPHQLMRVILLEQIYRCFRIIHGEPYHK